jgi:hypothetical protein
VPFGAPRTFGTETFLDPAVVDGRIDRLRGLPRESRDVFGLDGCYFGIALAEPEPWEFWWWSCGGRRRSSIGMVRRDGA